MKKLLALCLMSLAFSAFNGTNFVFDVIALINPGNYSSWTFIILNNLNYFLGIFWKLGFPIFFGFLFPKTRRWTWLMWPVAMASIGAPILDDLARWEIYTQFSWWSYELSDWVWDTTFFITTFAWIFYGGLVCQKLTQDINFTQFRGFNLKDWYQNLIKE